MVPSFRFCGFAEIERTAVVNIHKNARLKFIKSQSGMDIAIFLYLVATKNYWITGGLW